MLKAKGELGKDVYMLAGVSGGRGVLERDLDMSGVRLGLRSARILMRGRHGDLK